MLHTTLWPSILKISSPVSMFGFASAAPCGTMCPTVTCDPSSVPPTMRKPKPDGCRSSVTSDNRYP